MPEPADAIIRQYITLKLADAAEHVEVLADGSFAFSDADVWLRVYRQILETRGITKYWSIAWVKSADYWQNEFGRQCIAADFEAIEQNTLLQRLVILSDDVWPASVHLPREPIRQWLEDQNNVGVWLGLIRESALAGQPDLPIDVGIFGEGIVATQEFDHQCQSLCFVLSFDAVRARKLKIIWNRLKSQVVSYWTLLDQLETKE